MIAVLASASAQASEIRISGNDVALIGSIENDDIVILRSLSSALEGSLRFDISVTSGDLDTAIALGRLINSKDYKTHTELEACRNLCALLWLSGQVRTKPATTRIDINAGQYSNRPAGEHGKITQYLANIGLESDEITALKSASFEKGMQADATSDTGRDRYADYRGETRNGVPHGEGIWTVGAGDTYTGTFRNGLAHGSGVIETVEGDRLEGEFIEVKSAKNSVLHSAEGRIHRGPTKKLIRQPAEADQLVRVSKYSLAAPYNSTGDTTAGQTPTPIGEGNYTGPLKRGSPHGAGTIAYGDGSRFTGWFKNGVKNGPGILLRADGSRLSGMWKDNLFLDGSAPERPVKVSVSAAEDTTAPTPVPVEMVSMRVLVSGLDRNAARQLQQRLNEIYYDVGAPDGQIGRKTRAAIEAYARDFGLAGNRRFASNLIARINGTTADSVPGWRTVDDANCRIWNNVVHAITSIRWTGKCHDGYASGFGFLTVGFVLKGQQVSYTYIGPIKAGRISGIGTERWGGKHPEKGNRYHGSFVDGIRHGSGTYSSPGFGRIEGEFRAGKPHGHGDHYDSRGRLRLSGNFKEGCLKSGSKRVFAFTTRQACGF